MKSNANLVTFPPWIYVSNVNLLTSIKFHKLKLQSKLHLEEHEGFSHSIQILVFHFSMILLAKKSPVSRSDKMWGVSLAYLQSFP